MEFKMAAFERTSLDLVPKIRNILKTDVPGGIVPSQMLELYVECQKVTRDLDVRLYTPGGQVDPYATYIIYIPEHRGNTVFHSNNPYQEDLASRISAIPDIDWTTCRLGPVDFRLHSIVMDIMTEKKPDRNICCHKSDNFAISREESLQLDANFRVPDDLELRPVTIDKATIIDQLWPYRGPNTVKYIEDTIKTRGGVALYKKGSDEMLSWALYSMVGGVGMIQTAESQRRKGYAEIVARYLTKKIAEYGEVPQVQVQQGLSSSKDLFTKIGYTFTHEVAWYWYCD